MNIKQCVIGTLILVMSLAMLSCRLGQFLGPTVTLTPTVTSTSTITLTPTSSPTSTPTFTITPTLTLTSTLTPTPTFTLTPLPVAYETINVNEYDTFTVYWKRDLWESAVDGNISTEDFEKDTADYGELGSPYLTANGFLLQGGQCPSQIFKDPTQMDSGNLLHFRDFGCGLSFGFPNNVAASAFGFDYRPSEPWILKVNNQLVKLSGTRKSFVGIVFHKDYPSEFVLVCHEHVQGGLSVDNISYLIASTQ